MDENLQPQDGMNPELEIVEDIEPGEDIEALKAELEQSRRAQAEILARAKKAEAQLKEQKPTTNGVSKEDLEMTILKSQGVTDELLNGMRDLAKIRGKSILEIQSDPIIVAMKAEQEKEAKQKASSLGTSRGSAPIKKEKDVTSPGLSEEDHKALWKATLNK